MIQLIADASGDYLKIDTESNSLGGIPFKRESCDIYSIHCSTNLRDQVPFLVLPYVVTDLPILLWWSDEIRLNDEALNKLLLISSRAIISTPEIPKIGNRRAPTSLHYSNNRKKRS